MASDSVSSARTLSTLKDDLAFAAAELRQSQERVASLERQLELLTARLLEVQGQLDDAAGRSTEATAALVLENLSLKEKLQGTHASLSGYKQDSEQAFARAATLAEDVKARTRAFFASEQRSCDFCGYSMHSCSSES